MQVQVIDSRGGNKVGLILVLAFLCAAALVIITMTRQGETARETLRSDAPLPPEQEIKTEPPGTTAPQLQNDGAGLARLQSRAELVALLQAKLARGSSSDELRALLGEIARVDPRLALDLAETISQVPEEKYLFVSSVLRIWAQANFQAAWQWTLQQNNRLDSVSEAPLTSVILEQAALSDPLAVTAAIETLLLRGGNPPDIEPAALASSAVDALLKARQNDVAKATVEQWALSPAANKLDNSVFEKIALHQAESSPQAAGAWLLSLPAGEARNYAVATLTASWAEKDPASAVNWAFQLDPQNGRLSALLHGLNRWTDQDPVATAQWLGKNESDPAMNPLIANLVNDSTLPLNHPDVAVQWAELITEPSLRAQTIEQALFAWAAKDRPAALRHLNQIAALSPDQKRTLGEKLQAKTPVP